jgi:hypothetical protein
MNEGQISTSTTPSEVGTVLMLGEKPIHRGGVC